MAYRDEQEALLARLEATEQRLRVAENELADAKRRLEEPLVLQPSAPPPSSRRVGYPPVAAAPAQYGVVAAVSGTVLSVVGIAFLLWNLPGDEGLGDIAATLALAAMFGLLPGAGLLYFSIRRPARRAPLELESEPPRARVAPQARVEVAADLIPEEAEEDEGRCRPEPSRIPR
jgi:hypothetical protein